MKPVSRTAFYCTGVRALDARKPRPACGDQYAERFMDDEAWKLFEPFRSFTGPNISNATRHRIIDDLLRDRLADHHDLRIVIIGAGFDSRAFRLKGGRWYEVDEPQVLAWKEPRLPASESPNPLMRIPVDFAVERLADRLRPLADPGRVAIVVEGVLVYLGESRIRELLQTLRHLFPQGEILCDVMTREFFDKFAKPMHKKLVELGASFALPERPLDAIFADEHYEQITQASIARRAVELGQMPFMLRLVERLVPALRNGYSVRAFAPEQAASRAVGVG
jgi:methyltransferase (TIGR00027 family)